MAAAVDWDQLLQISEDLAARDTQGFPLLQRDLHQVEQLSQKLKSKARRIDAGADSLAAARLLAQEGISAQRISKDLQAFQLQPSQEDGVPATGATLDEYLQQVHELTVVTAIQEAQRNNVAAFEDFMAQCRREEWTAAKREIFGMSTADGIGDGSIARSPNPLRSPSAPTGQSSADATHPEQQLTALEKAYLDVVRRLNAAHAQGNGFDAASEFATAAAASPASQGGRASMPALWQVLVRMLAEGQAGHPPTATTLLKGSRKYLERLWVEHMSTTIHANRAQAALGGAPTRKGQVRAFLRVILAARGPLDFDAAGGADTLWHRIFLYLRSGFHQEALEEAKPLVRDVVGRGGSFEQLVREWVNCDGHLTGTSSTIMASECVRLLGSADPAAARSPSFHYKLLVYTLLSGNRISAEQVMHIDTVALLQSAIQQGLLATIEDFLWFTIALVQPPQDVSGFDAGASARAGEAYQLSDLQDHISRYPPEHYGGGRDPLPYAFVLLLTVQPKALTAFLAKHPSASAYRTDAVHLAIALLHHKVWEVGGPKDSAATFSVDAAPLIQRYGQSFAATAPDIALEYYMQAAQAAGGSADAKGQLLKDLLTQSNAFGFLLGSGSTSGTGALQRLLPTARERGEVLSVVARECQAAGQSDWAIELFLAGGQAAAALHIICHQLALLVPAALTDTRRESEVQQVIVRGNSIAAQLATNTSSQAVSEAEAFATLKIMRRLLRAQHGSNSGEAAAALAELTFLPQDNFRVRRCVEAVPKLHGAVAALLAAAVAAGGRALAAQGQKTALRALASFAAELPQRISPSTLRELNHLQSELP